MSTSMSQYYLANAIEKVKISVKAQSFNAINNLITLISTWVTRRKVGNQLELSLAHFHFPSASHQPNSWELFEMMERVADILDIHLRDHPELDPNFLAITAKKVLKWICIFS